MKHVIASLSFILFSACASPSKNQMGSPTIKNEPMPLTLLDDSSIEVLTCSDQSCDESKILLKAKKKSILGELSLSEGKEKFPVQISDYLRWWENLKKMETPAQPDCLSYYQVGLQREKIRSQFEICKGIHGDPKSVEISKLIREMNYALLKAKR